MRILAFAASLRRESINKRLLARAVEIAREKGAEVDHADFAEFDMPLYNADIQNQQGFPPGVRELERRILAADGIILCSPEYNFSVPGTLKNAIDWISRIRPTQPLDGKNALLIATSGGVIGGIRGLWQLRIPIEGLNCIVYPEMYALPQGPQNLDESNRVKDPALAQRLETLIEKYLAMAAALTARG